MADVVGGACAAVLGVIGGMNPVVAIIAGLVVAVLVLLVWNLVTFRTTQSKLLEAFLDSQSNNGRPDLPLATPAELANAHIHIVTLPLSVSEWERVASALAVLVRDEYPSGLSLKEIGDYPLDAPQVSHLD